MDPLSFAWVELEVWVSCAIIQSHMLYAVGQAKSILGFAAMETGGMS